jgi:hypothetical protein
MVIGDARRPVKARRQKNAGPRGWAHIDAATSGALRRAAEAGINRPWLARDAWRALEF